LISICFYFRYSCLFNFANEEGKNLALLESRLIISSILHRYDFKFVDPNYKIAYGLKGKAIPPPIDNLPVYVSFCSDR
jgi:hypothetical protein